MYAILRNYRQAPRKVRLVANLVKGKTTKEALASLAFLPKRAAAPLKKLISGAVANAKANFQANPENLVIKDIRVDKGRVLKRFRPASRGRSSSVHKHTSQVRVTLEVK